MPLIQELPNSTSSTAPGWAYVPDTGYDPSKAAIQPSARKRAGRTGGGISGDTTARQQNAINKHLVELEKDNHRDVKIDVPVRGKDSGRVSKSKTTTAVRRILTSQKTFANYISDEEALLAQTPSQAMPPPPLPHNETPKSRRASGQRRKSSVSVTAMEIDTPNEQTQAATPSQADAQPAEAAVEEDDDPLLRVYVPSAPSEEMMEALLSAPMLSYNESRAQPSTSGRPQRHFCEICGYWGTVRCMKCGARVCGLDCKTTHDDGRCLKFYA